MKFIFLLLVIGVTGIYFSGFINTKPMERNADVLSTTSTIDKISNGIKDAIIAEVTSKIKENISSSEPLKKFFGSNTEVMGNLTVSGTVTVTNIEREKGGLKPLVPNAKLEKAAQAKVSDMFTRQYFAHEAPTGEGPSVLASDAGYSFVIVGENLALGQFVDDVDLVTAWMNSPGHRENIMSSSYTEIGIAVGKGLYEGQEVWLAVQEFGTPLSACSAPAEDKKIVLDAQKKQLDQMDDELISMKQTLEEQKNSLPPETYNDKVRVYNAKVAEYNLLLEKSKKAMTAYNAEVVSFNECVATYTK